MKILHTADLHLRDQGDERWQVLEELIRLGREERIGVFVISGDLFNRDVDAENLRAPIRELFSNNDLKVVICPGNHDKSSFKEDLFFGEDAVILGDRPVEIRNARFCGLPFENLEGDKLVSKLRLLGNFMKNDKTNILVYHGELLDSFFSRKDFGEEGEGRYMPARLSYFRGLNIDYVLAGHFHTRFDVRAIEEKSYFVYPGSPISITRRETGQRQVNLFETGKPPSGHLLDTPFFDETVITLDPFCGENPMEKIKEELENVHPKARVILRIAGYIDGKSSKTTESGLVSEIKKLTKRKSIEASYEFRDIQKILDNDIFRNFLSRLEQSGMPQEEFEKQRDIAVRAFMEAGL